MVVLFALTMSPPLSVLGCAAALAGFGAFVYLATHNDYRWVELEGNTIRAGHLYTGRTIERSWMRSSAWAPWSIRSDDSRPSLSRKCWAG